MIQQTRDAKKTRTRAAIVLKQRQIARVYAPDGSSYVDLLVQEIDPLARVAHVTMFVTEDDVLVDERDCSAGVSDRIFTNDGSIVSVRRLACSPREHFSARRVWLDIEHDARGRVKRVIP